MASFKAAFAAARKAGKKTFSWNGKPYTTKLASESKSKAAPTKSAKPKARPAAAKPKSTGKAGSSSGRKAARGTAKKPMQGPTKSKLGLVNRMKNKPKTPSTGSRGRRRKQTSGSDR